MEVLVDTFKAVVDRLQPVFLTENGNDISTAVIALQCALAKHMVNVETTMNNIITVWHRSLWIDELPDRFLEKVNDVVKEIISPLFPCIQALPQDTATFERVVEAVDKFNISPNKQIAKALYIRKRLASL